jgi:ribosome-binding protein aMBF1 (putative translation factor)
MQRASTNRFQQIREQRMQRPEFRQRYERTRGVIARIQDILTLIDTQREAAGLSKAELARRVGMHPAAIRRLLSSGTGSPTLKTLLELMDVLGIEMHLRTRAPREMPVHPQSPRRRTPGSARRPVLTV